MSNNLKKRVSHSDNDPLDKCFFHAQARIIRADEGKVTGIIPYSLKNRITTNSRIVSENFQEIGCYKCSGYSFGCKSYKSLREATQ